jgi:hypothetical protein
VAAFRRGLAEIGYVEGKTSTIASDNGRPCGPPSKCIGRPGGAIGARRQSGDHHNLVDRGSTASTKGEVHLADRVAVQRVTRALDVPVAFPGAPGWALDWQTFKVPEYPAELLPAFPSMARAAANAARQSSGIFSFPPWDVS